MTGAIRLLHLHAFPAWTETTALLLFFNYIVLPISDALSVIRANTTIKRTFGTTGGGEHSKVPHNTNPHFSLTFMGPCIVNVFLSITNKMQRHIIFFITVNALHVSGVFSAHHQELKNCTHSTRCMSSLLAAIAIVGEFATQASSTYMRCCVYSF